MAETSGSYTDNCSDCTLNEGDLLSESGNNEREGNSGDGNTDGDAIDNDDDDDDDDDDDKENVDEDNNDNKEKESSTGIVAGATLGGAILVFVLSFLSFMCYFHIRNKQSGRQSGKSQHQVYNPAYQTEGISIDQIVVEIKNKNSDVYEEINEEKQKCPNECRVTNAERDKKVHQVEVEKVGENHLNETDKICRDRRGPYDHIKPGPSSATPSDDYDRALNYGKKNENPEDDQKVTVA
ncbi:protein PFC0760c-like [Saccostrea echinata]|uniref:protein PFC0760c-like n=1 Tax=Saccostrea echinata TaxID=191078 RepID=UPI002A7F15F8|nr:protein PFC0760c-like [Saccostrea echinata]